MRTAIQPIALADMICYLSRAIEIGPGVCEVGGGDATSCRETIAGSAATRGIRRRRAVPDASTVVLLA
ncbi:MAG: hypothetical protein ACYCSF_13210 [Acidimicrobiales bacterium]